MRDQCHPGQPRHCYPKGLLHLHAHGHSYFPSGAARQTSRAEEHVLMGLMLDKLSQASNAKQGSPAKVKG